MHGTCWGLRRDVWKRVKLEEYLGKDREAWGEGLLKRLARLE